MFRRMTAVFLLFSLFSLPALAAHKESQPVEEVPIPAAVQIDTRQQAIADYWSTLTPEAIAP